MRTDVNIEELYAALNLDSLACLGPRDNQQSCHLDTGRCHLDQLSPARQPGSVGGGVGSSPLPSRPLSGVGGVDGVGVRGVGGVGGVGGGEGSRPPLPCQPLLACI